MVNKIIAKGLLLPKDKISRNGVLYDWESIKQNYKKLIGLPMLYNHLNESDKKPVGKFIDSWIKEEDDEEGPAGWYYKADINPNSEYADSILRGDLNKVSVQVIASKQKRETTSDGRVYTRAYISDILEASVVPTPGFMETSINVKTEKFNLNSTMHVLSEKLEVDTKMDDTFEEMLTKLDFTDEQTTRDAEEILKKHNINCLANYRKYVILFNNEIDKKKAIDVLEKSGMHGLKSQEQITTDNTPTKTKILTPDEEDEEKKKEVENMVDVNFKEDVVDILEAFEEKISKLENMAGTNFKEEYDDTMSKIVDILETLEARISKIEDMINGEEKSEDASTEEPENPQEEKPEEEVPEEKPEEEVPEEKPEEVEEKPEEEVPEEKQEEVEEKPEEEVPEEKQEEVEEKPEEEKPEEEKPEEEKLPEGVKEETEDNVKKESEGDEEEEPSEEPLKKDEEENEEKPPIKENSVKLKDIKIESTFKPDERFKNIVKQLLN